MKTLSALLFLMFLALFVRAQASYPTASSGSISSADSLQMRQAAVNSDRETSFALKNKQFYGNPLSDIVIYPNPANDYLRISWNAYGSEKTTIKLLDNIGNPVSVKEIATVPGQNQILLDLSGQDVRSGFYFLQIQTGSDRITRKFVVRK